MLCDIQSKFFECEKRGTTICIYSSCIRDFATFVLLSVKDTHELSFNIVMRLLTLYKALFCIGLDISVKL